MSPVIEDNTQRGILIVDDEKVILDLTSIVLKKRGYQKVFTATNCVNAISILEAHASEIYVVLLDYMMPGMLGIELIRHLSNVHNYHVGIIMFTGKGNEEVASEFYKASSDKVISMDYIIKPFNNDRLAEHVNEVLCKIHKKRIGHLSGSAEQLFNKINTIEEKLKHADLLPEIYKEIHANTKLHSGFLAEIGKEIIKAVVIAIFIIAVLYVGIGDFIKQIIQVK